MAADGGIQALLKQCDKIRGLATSANKLSCDDVWSEVTQELDNARAALETLTCKLLRSMLLASFGNSPLSADGFRSMLQMLQFNSLEVDLICNQLAAAKVLNKNIVHPEQFLGWLWGERMSSEPATPRDRPRVDKKPSTPARCHGQPKENLELRALSLHYLQTTLVKQMEEANLPITSSVHDIEEAVIRGRSAHVKCPRDSKDGAAYVDVVDGEDNVGQAEYMLSYTWQYRICDILETLDAWCKRKKLDPKRVYMWMCCTCVNQHRVKEMHERKEVVPFEEFKKVFGERVSKIRKSTGEETHLPSSSLDAHLDKPRNIIAMMMPWHSPGYLTRSWCMFEMHTAIQLGEDKCCLEICMPPQEEAHFMKEVIESEGLKRIWGSLHKASINFAEATIAEDKQHILQLVNDGVGQDNFDTRVKQHVQRWFLQVASKHVAQLPYSFLMSCFKLGRLCSDLRMNAIAESIFRFCWDNKAALRSTPFKKSEDPTLMALGASHDEVTDIIAHICHQLGWLHHKNGKFEKALETYKDGLQLMRDEQAKGVSLSKLHDGCLRSLVGDEPDQDYIAPETPVPSQEAIQKAMEHAKDALDNLTELGWGRTEEAAQVLSNMSMAYTLGGEYAQALAALEQAGEIRKDNDTLKLPSNARRLYNLGSVHLKRLRMKESADPAGDWGQARRCILQSLDIAKLNANAGDMRTSEAKLKWLQEYKDNQRGEPAAQP